MEVCWICLGSNEEPRLYHIKKTLEVLSEFVKIRKISPVFESPAEGFLSYPFYNVAVKCETKLTPYDLIRFTKKVEILLGRERKIDYISHFFFSSRTIDIDIIFYGDKVVKTPEIEIPHPRAHRRIFVILPILSTGENPFHPVLKKTIREIFEEMDKEEIFEVCKI